MTSYKSFELVFFRHNRRFGEQPIHPDSQETVQNARDRLHEENRLPSNRTSDRRQREQELSCPICISSALYAVETNCGHVFCGMHLV